MSSKILHLLKSRFADEDIPAELRKFADEWELKPPGIGILMVVVKESSEYPEVFGFGKFGQPLTELELARMLLLKYYLGDML